MLSAPAGTVVARECTDAAAGSRAPSIRHSWVKLYLRDCGAGGEHVRRKILRRLR